MWKPDDTQDAIGFGQAPFEYTLKIWNLTAAPRLMVLLRQVSHLHQNFDGCNHFRTTKYLGDRSDNTGIVVVLPVCVDRTLFHRLSWCGIRWSRSLQLEQSETACYSTSRSPELSYSRDRVSSVRRAAPRLERRQTSLNICQANLRRLGGPPL